MTSPLPLTPDAIERLTVTTEPWLSCDDCFDDVDAVAEGVLIQTVPMSDPFRIHLLGCSVCYEEASSLAMLTAPDYALDPTAAAALLETAVHSDRPSGGTSPT